MQILNDEFLKQTEENKDFIFLWVKFLDLAFINYQIIKDEWDLLYDL